MLAARRRCVRGRRRLAAASRRRAAPRRRRQRRTRGEATSRHLRLRHARHGLRLRSRTTRTGSTSCGRRSCRRSTNEFGEDGHFFAGVRQSRLGVKGFIPTDVGELKTIFEFELFGTGVDAGQTTFRLRHAYGRVGQFGAGQTWSPFMDLDVFPNSIEYWGPNGMVFFRNVQIRWMPMQRRHARHDRARAAGRLAPTRASTRTASSSQDVKARFPLPDLSAQFRMTRRLGPRAGRRHRCATSSGTTSTPTQFDLSGDAIGWGINLSTNLKFAEDDMLRASVVYGEGIENYMNDAPVDIGTRATSANPRHAGQGQGAARPRHRRVPRPHLERQVDEHGRLLARRHRQHRPPGRRRVQDGPVRARQPPLLPRRRT